MKPCGPLGRSAKHHSEPSSLRRDEAGFGNGRRPHAKPGAVPPRGRWGASETPWPTRGSSSRRRDTRHVVDLARLGMRASAAEEDEVGRLSRASLCAWRGAPRRSCVGRPAAQRGRKAARRPCSRRACRRARQARAVEAARHQDAERRLRQLARSAPDVGSRSRNRQSGRRCAGHRKASAVEKLATRSCTYAVSQPCTEIFAGRVSVPRAFAGSGREGAQALLRQPDGPKRSPTGRATGLRRSAWRDEAAARAPFQEALSPSRRGRAPDELGIEIGDRGRKPSGSSGMGWSIPRAARPRVARSPCVSGSFGRKEAGLFAYQPVGGDET